LTALRTTVAEIIPEILDPPPGCLVSFGNVPGIVEFL